MNKTESREKAREWVRQPLGREFGECQGCAASRAATGRAPTGDRGQSRALDRVAVVRYDVAAFTGSILGIEDLDIGRSMRETLWRTLRELL